MQGAIYARVSGEVGTSVGSISNIMEEERRKTPDFDELRRLQIMLNRNNRRVPEASKGAELTQNQAGCGPDLKDLEDFFGLVKDTRANNQLEPSFMKEATQLRQLAQENGMLYEMLNQDYRSLGFCERFTLSIRTFEPNEHTNGRWCK